MTPALTRRIYISSWLMLGAIALGYFYFLFHTTLNPQLAQSSATPVAQPENTGKSDPAKMGADPGVSQAIAHMRLEMGRLKGSLEAMGKENAALKAHIKTLETAFGETTASLPREPAKTQPGEMKAKATARSAPQPKVEVTMLPMPGNGFAEIDIQRAPLPIAGPVAPTRTLFAVQLTKNLKPGGTRAHWAALKKRHARILGQLQPRAIEVSSNRPGKKAVNLLAGPFTNAAGAARACARLRAAGTKCKNTVYGGTPIGKVATR